MIACRIHYPRANYNSTRSITENNRRLVVFKQILINKVLPTAVYIHLKVTSNNVYSLLLFSYYSAIMAGNITKVVVERILENRKL